MVACSTGLDQDNREGLRKVYVWDAVTLRICDPVSPERQARPPQTSSDRMIMDDSADVAEGGFNAPRGHRAGPLRHVSVNMVAPEKHGRTHRRGCGDGDPRGLLRLATCGEDCGAHVYEVGCEDDGITLLCKCHLALVGVHGHSASVNCSAFSPAGTFLMTCADDKTVKIWWASPADTAGPSNTQFQAPFAPRPRRSEEPSRSFEITFKKVISKPLRRALLTPLVESRVTLSLRQGHV